MRKPASSIEKKMVAKILENVPDNQFTPVPYYYELLDSIRGRVSGIVCTESQTCIDFVLCSVIRDALAELQAASEQRAPIATPPVVYLHQSESHCQTIAATLNRHLPWLAAVEHTQQCSNSSSSTRASILVTTPALLHASLGDSQPNKSTFNGSLLGSRLVVLENAELYADSEGPDGRLIRGLLDRLQPVQFVGSSAELLQGLTGAQGPCLSDLIAGLKATFNCSVTFASDVLSALIHGGQPDEELLDCPAPDDAFGLYSGLRELIQSHLDWLLDLSEEFTVSPPKCPEAKQFCIKALRQCLNGLDNLGPWGCNVIARVCLKHLVSLEQELLADCDQLARCLVRSTVTQLAVLQKRFHAVQEEFIDVEDFRRVVPPNVHRLLDLLGRFRPRTEFSIEFISDSFGGDGDGCYGNSAVRIKPAGNSELVDLSDAASTDSDDDDDLNGDSIGRSIGGGVEITELNNANCLPYKVVPKCPSEEPTERLSALVFVKDCFTAYGLCKLLDEVCIWDPDFFFIKPAYMFSLVTRPKQQRITDYLKKFRQGEANLLVVTEAMESRGDLPKCNLVVRFNPPRTFNSYFHSKNRARSFNSTYATIVTPLDSTFIASHGAFKATEELLLRSGGAVVTDTSQFESAQFDNAEIFAPFGPSGPSVTADAAIPIVNRYCARLPSDVFASLVPLWRIETRPGQAAAYRCELRLPMNSPVRQSSVGSWRSTVQAAKANAALACVRALHSAGQLDSSLKPFSKEELVNHAQQSLSASPLVGDAAAASLMLPGPGGMAAVAIGGSKRRQVYPKQLAAQLTSGVPAANEACRLYRIRLRPEHVWAMPSAEVAAADDAAKSAPNDRSFGLILRDPLPAGLPLFCLYPRQGETDVDFPLVSDSLVLTSDQRDLLLQFHRILFQRVLRLEKEVSMLANFDLSPFTPLVSLLIRCPVAECAGENTEECSNWQLDWDLIKRVVTSSVSDAASDAPPPCEIRPEKPFKFRVEDFNDCVIVPSYRNFDQPQFYFVSQVRWDLTPASPFPTSAYESFEEYYLKKYNIRLTTREQPLLDVEQSSSRYNVLTPRFLDTDGRPMGTRAKQQQQSEPASNVRCLKDEQQKQLFIPELCYRHVVPASVWRQACCLPSALYRLNHLLLAESLRQQIAASTGVGVNAESSASSAAEKLAYCPLLPAGSGGADGKLIADTTTISSERDTANANNGERVDGDADFGVFQSDGTGGDDDDPLLGEAGPGEAYEDDDAESTDSFEEMVTFFPRVSLADTWLPNAADVLQCLTASNAGDLMNLERLETVGDSLLKFAVTISLYCANPGLHEGGLTQLRSRQVSNSNLYLCALAKGLGKLIVACKFEPRDNWLPPGLVIKQQQKSSVDSVAPASTPPSPGSPAAAAASAASAKPASKKRSGGGKKRNKGKSGGGQQQGSNSNRQQAKSSLSSSAKVSIGVGGGGACSSCLQLEQSLTDKCLADSVEAIIGCYLVRCNEQAALRICRWFGVAVGNFGGVVDTGDDVTWPVPPDPVLSSASALMSACDIEAELNRRLTGYEEFEAMIGYRFKNRAYLLQAFTHPSDYSNELTDCYQRLEFLGDAVLDYVVTRYLFHDSRRHSPAVLTDLRSALVNNDIFGALAVKWGFHKYFRCVSPALHALIDQFVQFQKDDKEDNLDFVTSQEADFDDRPEDVEIPKCLGDIFESVAGAVFLDSGMSLDTVWRVFYPLLKERIECYTAEIPKSLVRELLETEPDCTKFERPTRTASGTIRVVVHIIGKGRFAGVGRNYRIARNSAAKVALRYIKAREREKAAAAAAAAAAPPQHAKA